MDLSNIVEAEASEDLVTKRNFRSLLPHSLNPGHGIESPKSHYDLPTYIFKIPPVLQAQPITNIKESTACSEPGKVFLIPQNPHVLLARKSNTSNLNLQPIEKSQTLYPTNQRIEMDDCPVTNYTKIPINSPQPTFNLEHDIIWKDYADKYAKLTVTSLNVSERNIEDGYVQFLIYHDPSYLESVKLMVNARNRISTLPKTFAHNVHCTAWDLFCHVLKLQKGQIKNWSQLVGLLGLEGAIARTQYAQRIKRWMHKYKIDCYFNYLLGNNFDFHHPLSVKNRSILSVIPAPKSKGKEKLIDQKERDECKRPMIVPPGAKKRLKQNVDPDTLLEASNNFFNRRRQEEDNKSTNDFEEEEQDELDSTVSESPTTNPIECNRCNTFEAEVESLKKEIVNLKTFVSVLQDNMSQQSKTIETSQQYINQLLVERQAEQFTKKKLE